MISYPTEHPTFKNYRWLMNDCAPEALLRQFPELPSSLVDLLFQRAVIQESSSAQDNERNVERFLTPDYETDTHDPFLFRDMTRATDRIYAALKNKERITMFGDYDADGVSAAVIIVSTLKALGANIAVYLPHRESEGYGMNTQAIEKIAQDGTTLLITGDCGVANVKEIAHANKLGIEVIVTDHHTLQNKLPPAFAIIHPLAPKETYPDKTLCGGAVAFKLVQGLLRHPLAETYWQKDEAPLTFEKWLLDLVAVSSVADMVPLTGETRVLTSYGLKVLTKTRRIGLRALLTAAGIKQDQTIDAERISFQIAPRINAAGRMDHANAAYGLLMTQDAQEAQILAANLERTNGDRQAMTEIIFNEALAKVHAQKEQPVYVVVGEDWPLSMVGLVAGKIVEQVNRPCFVLTARDGVVQGSGRGIGLPETDLMRALESVRELLKAYGGHAEACGLKLSNKKDLALFQKRLRAYFKKQLKGKDARKTLSINAQVLLHDISWDLQKQTEQIAPFGQQNPVPRYLLSNVKVEQLRQVGNNGKHLQLFISGERGKVHKTIGFSCGSWCELIKPGDMVDLVIRIDVNEWNGNKELQLELEDGRKV